MHIIFAIFWGGESGARNLDGGGQMAASRDLAKRLQGTVVDLFSTLPSSSTLRVMVIDPSNVVSLHRIFNHNDMMGLRMHIKPTTLTLHIAAENSGIFRTRSVCACSGHGNFGPPFSMGTVTVCTP